MNIPPKYEDVVAQLSAALDRESEMVARANQYKLMMDAACGEIATLKEGLVGFELAQQRLTVAEQRAEQLESEFESGQENWVAGMAAIRKHEQRASALESAAREMLRIAGIANQGSNAYNRAIINLHNALNPVETPYEYSGEDDFGHRERIAAALKPDEEGEGS